MMKKRFCTLLLALALMASMVFGSLPVRASAGDITLRIHYFREDGNYEGLKLWLWDTDAVPYTVFDTPFQFKESDGHMLYEAQVNTGTVKLGYVIRREITQFMSIEPTKDQFIELENVLSGTVDVYIKDRAEVCEIVFGDDVVRGPAILAASYKEKNSEGNPQVAVKMSVELDSEPTPDTFRVFNSDGAVDICAVKRVNCYYYLTLAEPLELYRGYTVAYRDKTLAVCMPDFYSRPEFEAEYTYTGDDLGASYTPEKTLLRLWAPLALNAEVLLYDNGDPETAPEPASAVGMTRDVCGTWICELPGDQQGIYYTYRVTYDTHVAEACDPYARATGVNGHRAMILDLASTDPVGWEEDGNTTDDGINSTDAVIYELHVGEWSSHESFGSSEKGKYMGVAEDDSVNRNAGPTGLCHIQDLGVTHVQLKPVVDFGGVDESEPEAEWDISTGYGPVNFNVPEGSYSYDPYNGASRVEEFKRMVQRLHESGISVVMDVIYSFVYDADTFCFNQLVPDYFTRPGSNGSGYGNDAATERSMVRKYIVDSVNYWADEYHIDGFCFEQVGLMDTDTVNEIVTTVREKHPEAILYGVGETLTTRPTKTGITMATQENAALIPNFAYFGDTLQNLITGNGEMSGFISDGNVPAEKLDACFKGMPEWCSAPSRSVNYLSSYHHTVFDSIALTEKYANEENRIKMNKLAAAFCITSQGIPFLRAGDEMLRTKAKENSSGAESSNGSAVSSDLNWDALSDPKCRDMYEYYRGLLRFRSMHPALRLSDAADVEAAIEPVSDLPDRVVAYRIQCGQEDEISDAIFCAFNAGTESASISLPEGEWNICIDGETAGCSSLGLVSGTVEVPARSAMVLIQEEYEHILIPPTYNLQGYILTFLGGTVLAALGIFLLVKKRGD